MNSLELREKRAKIWKAAKDFLDTHTHDGFVSAEDTATYERMESEVAELGHQIDRLERQAATDRALGLPMSEPLTAKPEAAKPVAENTRKVRPTATAEYSKAFWDFFRVKNADGETSKTLRIGDDEHGGYFAPDEFERTLIDKLEEENIFRQHAHVITTASGDRKIPLVKAKGIAAWIDEEAQYPESDNIFDITSIGAHKLATMIKVSEELLNDSVFDIPSYVAAEFARRIGAAEEEAFFTGDGTDRPLGVLTDGGAELGVTAASATAMTFDEIMDLFYSLKSPYRRKAAFYMNDSTVKAIRKLKDSNGQYLWQPSLTAGAPDTLLNKPIYTSPYMPTIAAGAKSILFGDLSYYWVADREGRSFKRLNELFAPTGQIGFLASERVDGKLILPESCKVLQQKA